MHKYFFLDRYLSKFHFKYNRSIHSILLKNQFRKFPLPEFRFIIENGTVRQVFNTILGNTYYRDVLWGLHRNSILGTTSRYKCCDATSTIHFSCFTILYCPILDLSSVLVENRISICKQYIFIEISF